MAEQRIFTEEEIYRAAKGGIVPGLRDRLDPGPIAMPNKHPSLTTWPAFQLAVKDGYMLQRDLSDATMLNRVWQAWCVLHQIPEVVISTYGMRETVRVSMSVKHLGSVFTSWGIRTLAEAWRRVAVGGLSWGFLYEHCWMDNLLPEQATELARMWLLTAKDPRATEAEEVAKARTEDPEIPKAIAIMRPREFTPLEKK